MFDGEGTVADLLPGRMELVAPGREQRRSRERQRIEKAALVLLLERGFDAVTAEDIAEAAAISRRTFFRYFPARDDVLCGVYVRSLRHLFELLDARPLEEPLIEALVNAARLDLAEAVDRDELEIANLSRQLMARDSEAWQRAVTQAQNPILEDYTKVIARRLQARGRSEQGARIIAATLWAVSCEIFFEWLHDGGAGSLPDRLLAGLETVRDALSE